MLPLVTQFGARHIFRELHQCRGAHYINGTLYVNRILCNAPKTFLERKWSPGRALITFHKLAKLILFIATIYCNFP